MSDFLKHECGIAAVRLRKPLAYYYDRYGTCLWGLNKLFLLMEKQHNRGQDGAGKQRARLVAPQRMVSDENLRAAVHRRRLEAGKHVVPTAPRVHLHLQAVQKSGLDAAIRFMVWPFVTESTGETLRA